MSEIIDMERSSNSGQTALLMSLKNNDFEQFKRILSQPEIAEFYTFSGPYARVIDINHAYDNHENKTLLEIACSSANRVTFVKYLLQQGANVNLINCAHGAAPIHLAVSHSDYDTVRLLVEHEHIDIHQPNSAGLTAFHLAAQRKRNDIIKLLQTRQAFEIEQAKIKVRKYKRSPARYEYDALDEANSLPYLEMSESSESDRSLSSLLKSRNYEAFKSNANEDNVQFIDDSLGFTYLQYACEFGLIEFVELLLDLNVDPNQTGRNRMTPITLAAYEGYHQIVQLLQNTGIITYDPVYEKNILHFILCGYEYLVKCTAERLASTEWLNPVNSHDECKKDYTKCLKLILDNVSHHQLNVDEWDERGNAPLHYAIVYDNRDMILSLIERGAYIGAANRHGDLPITLIKPATLEYLLDEGMWTTTYWNHSNRTVFNYNWLIPGHRRFSHKPTNEMNLLKALSEVSALKPLLKHPFFLVLLDFEWHIIGKRLLHIDLGFYFLFVSFFSLQELILNLIPEPKNRYECQLDGYSKFIVTTCNTFMLLKEFTQFIIYSKANKYAYVTNPRNYMKITLISIVRIVTCSHIPSPRMRIVLVTAAILLSYGELILLLSNHPSMSTKIEMFKVVARNTFKFLLSYVTFILAFTFAFLLLFVCIKPAGNSFNHFGGIFNATFKTLIMSTGEYDLTNTLIKDNSNVGPFVFILFVFFIHIVLLNLLNAIAVSDIQGIRKEAELISTVARIQLMADTEEVFSTLFSFLDLLVQFANYCICAAMGRRPSRIGTCERRYYYANYFGGIANGEEIIYIAKFGERGTISKRTFDDNLEFFVSPSTEQSIRETISAKTSKEEKADACYRIANFARVSATSQEVCKSLVTLMNALDKKYQIVEPMLTEIAELSNRKSK